MGWTSSQASAAGLIAPRSQPLLDEHRHAVFAGDGAFHDDLRLVARLEPELEARDQHGRDDVGLQQGEVVAQADALAGGEGVKGVGMAHGLGLRRPALGVEALGVRPEVGMAVGGVGEGDDARPAGDAHAVHLVVGHHVARRRSARPGRGAASP